MTIPIEQVLNETLEFRQTLRVSTALVESAMNSLDNHRMNKRRQMRWSAEGAGHVLAIRTAFVNGVLPTPRRLAEASERIGATSLQLAA